MATVAFNPPPCMYAESDVKLIRSIDGHDISTMCTIPFSVIQENELCTIDSYTSQQKCIIYSHGNAEDIQQIKSFASYMADNFDCIVLTWDPVGFGKSTPGTPTEDNMYSAIEAVYNHATEKLKIPTDKIILIGRSLGSAPTLHMASREYAQCHAVVLISPLASGFRTFAKPTSVGNRVCCILDSLFCPNINLIGRVRAPLCIVHGQQDTVVPVHNALELQEKVSFKYKFEPLLIDSATHNDIITKHQQRLLMYLETFFVYCDRFNQSQEPYSTLDSV